MLKKEKTTGKNMRDHRSMAFTSVKSGMASPQAAFLLCHVPFQGISAKTMPGQPGFPILDAGGIIGQHCAPWVSKSHHSLGGGHFIFYLKSAQ